MSSDIQPQVNKIEQLFGAVKVKEATALKIYTLGSTEYKLVVIHYGTIIIEIVCKDGDREVILMTAKSASSKRAVRQFLTSISSKLSINEIKVLLDHNTPRVLV